MQTRSLWQRLAWPRVMTWSAALVALIIMGHFWGHHIPQLEKYLAELGPWGPFAFIVIFSVVAPLGFSITALAIGAGALFGLFKGALVLIAAAFIAECLMFFLSRCFFKTQVEQYLRRHPKLSAMNKAATQQGVHFQILLRLTPIPYAACCYLLSLSGTKFSTYMLGFAGFIPGNFVFVYMGFMAKHATLFSHGISSHSPMKIALMIAGLVVTILIFAYFAHLAHKTLKNMQLDNGES